MDFLGDLASIFTVGRVAFAVVGSMLGWIIRSLTVKKQIRALEARLDRTEWDWADLKRLHPELVKNFPPRK